MSTQKQLHSRDARSVPESAPSVNDRLGPTQPRPAWLANIEAALLAARRAIRRAIQDQICDTRRVEFLTQSGPTSSSNPGPPRLREVPRVPAAAVGYLPALPAFLAFIDSRKR